MKTTVIKNIQSNISAQLTTALYDAAYCKDISPEQYDTVINYINQSLRKLQGIDIRVTKIPMC